MERILADVKAASPVVPIWSAGQQEQAVAFNNANSAVQPAVYFSPGLYEDLGRVYQTLQQAITASAAPQVDTKKSGGRVSLPTPATALYCLQSDLTVHA